jgi:glycerate kinase
LAAKGATPKMIARLDQALGHYAKIIARDLDQDVLNLAGGGAAGGWAQRCMPSVARNCVRALKS